MKHKSITADVAKTIQQGRQAKGWSQKDLATVKESFVMTFYCEIVLFLPYHSRTYLMFVLSLLENMRETSGGQRL